MNLNDSSLLKATSLIANQWHQNEKHDDFSVVNPATLETVAEVAVAPPELIHQAIDVANEAFAQWKKSTATTRSEYLMRWHDLVEANLDDLAQLITLEQGKPLAEARAEIRYANSYLKWFAEAVHHYSGQFAEGAQAGQKRLVSHSPVGVCALITPWNFPLAMLARKAAAALAAGCTIVAKPSELTPLTALAFAELGVRAGLPEGVFNCVVAQPEQAGSIFTGSKGIQKISFTGSTRVGQWLMERSGPQLHRLALELGGNAPAIVFDDANLKQAVAAIMAAKFRNNGQTCISINRLYIHKSVYSRVMALLAESVQGLRVGCGVDPDVDVGPLVNQAAVDKFHRHRDNALDLGAKPVAKACYKGQGKGHFVDPVLLEDATQQMDFCREETFGPLLAAIPFDDDEQALGWSNDTCSGLASYVFTESLSRSMWASETLAYGMVGLNCSAISCAAAPFGGIKHSGFGREGAEQGLREYQNTKYVLMQTSTPD